MSKFIIRITTAMLAGIVTLGSLAPAAVLAHGGRGQGGDNRGRDERREARIRDEARARVVDRRDERVRLRARLNGPEIDNIRPEGNADWRQLERGRGKRLTVEVEDVHLPDGTKLRIEACGQNVGTVTLIDAEARLRLRERDGDAVPVCQADSEAKVFSNDTLILSGKFMEKR